MNKVKKISDKADCIEVFPFSRVENINTAKRAIITIEKEGELIEPIVMKGSQLRGGF